VIHPTYVRGYIDFFPNHLGHGVLVVLVVGTERWQKNVAPLYRLTLYLGLFQILENTLGQRLLISLPFSY
jgi:hypothetical protein